MYSSRQYRSLAAGKRSVMEFEAQACGEQNPWHYRHIQQFCEYVDYSVAAVREEIKEMIAAAKQNPKVEVEVDEASVKKVRQKIEDMLSSILNLGRR